MNVRDVRDVDHAIEAVGGLPVVVKVTKGTQGQGVFLRHTAYEAKSLVQGLLHARRDVLIQEYVAESHGRDVRVIVVGDEVVAAMRRRAVDGNSAQTSTSTAPSNHSTCRMSLQTWPGALPACLA